MSRSHGFRISAVDVAFIAACSVGAIIGARVLGPYVWLIPIAVGHFFLFCNVFRIRRNYELIWTGVFLVNTSAWMHLGPYGDATMWLAVLAIQLPLTALFIVLEIRGDRYRGIFSRASRPPEA